MDAARRSATMGRPWFALDVARATAALLVLLAHARDLTLLDAGDQPQLSLAGQAFYAVAGLGHQAVIVFFVISGFLVTRSMLRLDATGLWSLRAFATARLTRLWIVLLPCLLIGALFDRIGMAHGSAAEAARYGVLALSGSASPALDTATLVGNVVFLQTVAVQPYGSNGALWSLANEAWYYAVAALLFGALRPGIGARSATAHLVTATIILLIFPWAIWALAPVWAFGAVLAILPLPTAERRLGVVSGLSLAASLVAVAGVIVIARLRLGPQAVLDDVLGLSTAWLLRSSLPLQVPPGSMARAVQRLSHGSYSLYLSHTPLLALLTAFGLGSRRMSFGGHGLLVILVDMTLALLFAGMVWWAFERRTDAVRELLGRGLSLGFGSAARHKQVAS